MQESTTQPEADEIRSVTEGDSLSARMVQRAEVLQRRTTERFPIPGYEGVLEVEFRALGYKTIRKVQQRNQKVRDPELQELYNMADQLLRATVGFHDVLNGAIDDDWVRLAQRMPDCPDGPTPRQALLFLVTDKRIHFLVEDWGRWAAAVRVDVDEELEEDFVTTG